ncbi:MAG: urate hydroxylase PuuD [Ignavibacteria bacterium]|nr:urate hydroxylase PuuD [Ignavibacteria bacterium]
MDALSVFLRWAHIIAGILWIGHLYFFNFVNAQIGTLLDGETKKKLVPQMLPRALYWFRWGAAWTWITGLLLLMLVFYHGGLMFEQGGWTTAAIVMVVLTFLVFKLYDVLAKVAGKNGMIFAVIGFVLIAAMYFLMVEWGGFSYRAVNIHIGAMFGTIMAANVWMIIWPAQKKIVAAVRDGETPDAGLAAKAGQRSRHNTYLSVPLIYTMINAHTVVPGASSMFYLFGVIILGWAVTAWLYKKAGTLKGF